MNPLATLVEEAIAGSGAGTGALPLMSGLFSSPESGGGNRNLFSMICRDSSMCSNRGVMMKTERVDGRADAGGTE